MNFGFDDDQKELGETIAKLLADFPGLTGPDLVPPHNDDIWNALAELGLFALLVPEEFGGVGLSLVDVALAVEALGAGLAPPCVIATLATTDLIVRCGSDAQRAALLPRLAAGQLKTAIAMLEPDQGYSASAFATTLRNDQVQGEKMLVADAADADLLIVIATENGRAAIALVERTQPGVRFTMHEDIDPSSGHCAIRFDDVTLNADARVATDSNEDAVARLLDVCATLHAGQLIGISARMLDASVEYAKTRVQFGQQIGAFQAIKHRCADMAVAVEAGRSAAYYAFWAAAEEAPDRARAASMAKAYCSEIARSVCNEAIQIHGGMGFTWELGLHRYLRRSKVLEHSFGDAAWHNERVLAATLQTMAIDHSLPVAA